MGRNMMIALAALLATGCVCFDDGAGGGGGGGGGGGAEGTTELCTNTCRFAHDGDCDDGGEGADYSLCELGSDCGDCGPRRVSGGGGGGGGGGLGCCCDPDTGVCTELVAGDADDWRRSCGSGSPGTYHEGRCPTLDFRCLGAEGTNELTGESVQIHLSFPRSICTYDGRRINTAGTCNTLMGCCEGTHCAGPDGTVPACAPCP